MILVLDSVAKSIASDRLIMVRSNLSLLLVGSMSKTLSINSASHISTFVAKHVHAVSWSTYDLRLAVLLVRAILFLKLDFDLFLGQILRLWLIRYVHVLFSILVFIFILVPLVGKLPLLSHLLELLLDEVARDYLLERTLVVLLEEHLLLSICDLVVVDVL